MIIKSIKVTNLRNIQSKKLDFSDQLNIFYGDNGAGKSSILEALYTLGHGRSFRTARHAKVIQTESDAFQVFSEFYNPQKEKHHKLGIQRHRNGDVVIKLDQEKIAKLSYLTKTLPLQILAPEQYELLTKGPSARRKLLDWGVFHVEHGFLSLWQNVHRLLSQRNSALKTAKSYNEIIAWDRQLVPASESIDKLRKDYVKLLSPIFSKTLSAFLPSVKPELRLYSGWKQDEQLADILVQQFALDNKTGFTRSSINKADLKIYLDNQLASDYLSRGQQKLVTTALKLSQLELMQQHTGICPVFLLDDIGAELDKKHQEVLLDYLANQPKNQQIFITSVLLDPLKSLIKGYNKAKLFHVEHGVIKEKHHSNNSGL